MASRSSRASCASALGSSCRALKKGAGSGGIGTFTLIKLFARDTCTTDVIVASCRGCVSGAQIKNMRDKSSMGGDDYRFDAIDGYDELEYVC